MYRDTLYIYIKHMTNSTYQSGVRWKLKALLDHHQPRPITRYALQKEAGVAMNTIRAMYDNTSGGVEFGTLGKVLRALQTLTGQSLTVADLIEYAPLTDEDTAWMNADLSRLAEEEPYDWGKMDPMTAGRPIHVNAAGEIVAGS